MQEEQNIEGFLQHWIWDVVLFSHVVHHVQETCGMGLTPQLDQKMTEGSRSSIAEVGRRGYKFSSLANSVRHAVVTLVSDRTMRMGAVLTQQGLSLYRSVGIFVCQSSPRIPHLLWYTTFDLRQWSIRSPRGNYRPVP